tara:strand:- start:5321 stop:5638 length:318 start_codon:yes stop_codon:yes gene_type:complete
MAEEIARETAKMEQAHAAMLGGVSVITSVIATHNKGSDASSGGVDSDGKTIPADFGYDMTHDEKKERVARSVGYLKYQKETFSDWGDKDFTDIDAAITAADAFTG